MKTKPLTFLLALTFLFLFGCSDSGDEQEVKNEFYPSGELIKETHYKNGKQEGLGTGWHESGKKSYEVLFWNNGKIEGVRKRWYAPQPLTNQYKPSLI